MELLSLATKSFAQRLREARQSLKLTQGQFAQAIGAAQSSVSKWEAGKERPNSDALHRISQFTGLSSAFFFDLGNEDDNDVVRWNIYPPIVGSIDGLFKHRGNWIEPRKVEFSIPMPPPILRNLEGQVFGYIISGNRSDMFFKNGDFVFAADADRLEPEHDDLVVVRRTDADGQTEFSLRRAVQGEEWWFLPTSNDPAYQSPVSTTAFGDGVIALEVLGTIIASFQFHSHAAQWRRKE